MTIKTVLWDIDATLLDLTEGERQSICSAFLHFGLGPCPEEVLALYPEINRRWWDWCEEGRKSKEEILWGRFAELLEKAGKDSSISKEFALYYMQHLGDVITFNPGGKEALYALQGEVKQYVVTNGVHASQDGKLRNSGIGKLMDGIFISDDIGYEKPSIEFFRYVLSSLGNPPLSSVVIIGDSLSTDMTGGVRAGIRTVWYNPKGKKAPENLRIDREISSLFEVPDLIKSL